LSARDRNDKIPSVGKIKSLSELENLCHWLKNQKKAFGLVTGCFDLLHLGHISLFRFAKKHVDLLMVGVDNDMTIRLSKNPDRPIFPHSSRLKLLAELEKVNYLYPVEDVFQFNTPRADFIHQNFLKKINLRGLIALGFAYWQKRLCFALYSLRSCFLYRFSGRSFDRFRFLEIKPDYVFSFPLADPYWQKRKRQVEGLGIKFLAQPGERRLGSSSKIIEKISQLEAWGEA
jgi:cytidyltransferase-like protein